MPSQSPRALRPALLLTLAWAVAMVATWMLTGWSSQQQGAPFAPGVLLVLPISSAVAVLIGFRAGNVAFVSGETGLGLGLMLTREHLLRMGGNMDLRRSPEGGGEAGIELLAG